MEKKNKSNINAQNVLIIILVLAIVIILCFSFIKFNEKKNAVKNNDKVTNNNEIGSEEGSDDSDSNLSNSDKKDDDDSSSSDDSSSLNNNEDVDHELQNTKSSKSCSSVQNIIVNEGEIAYKYDITFENNLSTYYDITYTYKFNITHRDNYSIQYNELKEIYGDKLYHDDANYILSYKYDASLYPDGGSNPDGNMFDKTEEEIKTYLTNYRKVAFVCK